MADLIAQQFFCQPMHKQKQQNNFQLISQTFQAFFIFFCFLFVASEKAVH